MNLERTQRKKMAALIAPLASKHPAMFLKPNNRLTARERLEIYRCSYWSRLLDSFREDFPGLAAILGPRAFERLATAYLTGCPSRSFTLRNLGSRLESWLRKHPRHTGGRYLLALDMVKLEWARIVAVDGPPARGLKLPDYLSLLTLHHPVDQRLSGARLRFQKDTIFLAVHRVEGSVYELRLTPEQLRLLSALRAGRSIRSAIGQAFRGAGIKDDDIPALTRTWFAAWAELGWLTHPAYEQDR